MEKFLEEQACPLDASVKVSQRCTDVTSMKHDIGHKLLAFLLWNIARSVDKLFLVLSIIYLKLFQMLLELLSQLIHRSHISEQNRFDYPLLDNMDFSWFEMTTQEVVVNIIE